MLSLLDTPGLLAGRSHMKISHRLVRIAALAFLLLILVVLYLRSPSSSKNQFSNKEENNKLLTSWLSLGGQKSDGRVVPPKFLPFETTSYFNPVPGRDDKDGEDDDDPSISITTKTKTADLCASFPNYLTSHMIQPVLKMGHAEDRNKRAAQLETVSACFSPPELLIFSDLDEDLSHLITTADTSVSSSSSSPTTHHRAINVLSSIPPSIFNNISSDILNPYLDLLRLQKSHTGTPITLSPQNDPTLLASNGTFNIGWHLDKYKFLAGLERAWTMRPNRSWYVFYETDTYVFWDNLFRFLSGMDPDVPLYMGSPSPGGEDWEKKRREDKRVWFANGGPGYVLSRAAMEKFLGRGKGKEDGGGGGGETGMYAKGTVVERWGGLLKSDCCGDSVLGWALWKGAGIPLSGLFPSFNVYPVHGIPFTERMWCQPVFTLHKTSPEDMRALWRWEGEKRRWVRLLLYSDLYHFHPEPTAPSGSSTNTPSIRLNWDNTNYDRLAPGRDVGAHDLASCTKACQDDHGCFQFLWRDNFTGDGQDRKCVLLPYYNYGRAREPETEQRNVTVQGAKGGGDGAQGWKMVTDHFNFTSGWLPARIGDWRDHHRCEEPEWLWPSVDRVF